jgi:hypothetical protein
LIQNRRIELIAAIVFRTVARRQRAFPDVGDIGVIGIPIAV